MHRNTSYQSKQSAHNQEQQQQQQSRPDLRNQHTASTIRPRTNRMTTQMSRMATSATGGTAQNGGYSLAGTTQQRQQAQHPATAAAAATRDHQGGPNRDTHVADGYRELNPHYEKREQEPTFSLGSNLPRTVRGWQGKKKSGARKNASTGVNPGEKGEGEAAPQLQDTDERRKHYGGDKQDAEPSQEARHANDQPAPDDHQEGGGGGEMMMQESRVQTADGEHSGLVGDQAVYASGAESDDTTLAPGDEEDKEQDMMNFNPWALFRLKFQDALGEWLGVSFVLNQFRKKAFFCSVLSC
jgi:aquaglyceroporin related protein